MPGESYGFEYDEDVESDEAFESSDETAESDESDESADEWVEAGEDTGESDLESDESFAAATEDVGEADLESDEAESDEALDEAEAVSAAARLRADRDRNRRATWARRIAADQRVGAQRAASAQRSLTTQIRSIRPGGPARVSSVGNLQGAGVVTAVLPNGRRSQMRIIPTMAPVTEVNRLRAVVLTNEKRQAVATSRNSRAIAALATTQAATVKRLTDQQIKSDKDIAKRIVEGDNRLDMRITKELSGGAGVMGKHNKSIMRMFRRQRQRSLMNSVLLATSAPFFAAYGDRQNPFGKNNLILTGSLLGWLVGDDLVARVAGKSDVLRGGTTAWSYLAPVGNGLTAYLLFRNKQNQRFVSGITKVKDGKAIVPLNIAKGSLEQFKKDKHFVAATIVGTKEIKATSGEVTPDTTAMVVNAEVKDENLVITLLNPNTTSDNAGAPANATWAKAETQVAWIVDTRASSGVDATTTPTA